MGRKIASHYALIGGELRRGCIVEVADDGTIVGIEQCDNIDNRASVEFHPGILIAGMINAHCHLELAYLRGAIEEATGFAGFASAIGRVRGNYSEEQRLRAASAADALMWEEGIQAVADIANDALVMPIKRKSKIEYRTFFEFFGLCNNECDKLLTTAKQEGATLTPHSTYSVQDGPFRKICNSDSKLFSLHFLESEQECALYRGEGSLAEWYTRMGWQCDFLHYGGAAERLRQSIPPHKRLLLVHACEATPEDVATLNNHFEHRPSWVLCPESNRYISGIKPPVAMLRSVGAEIALGTDSLASARSLSMVENMRLLNDDVELVELLRWATIGGAKALGVEDRLGDIAIGKRPGLVVIEGADLSNLRLTEESRSRRIL